MLKFCVFLWPYLPVKSVFSSTKQSIELLSLVEIVDLQNDPVECWRHSGSFRI